MYGKNIEHIHPIGMVTDDTQMTCALINSLIEDECYDEESAIKSYVAWAHSGNTGMGKNTQDLFKNKTYKGYVSRYNRMLSDIEDEKRGEPLSNGCLMRCAPLAIFSSTKPLRKDTKITNPFRVCIDANLIYYQVLRHLLLGGGIEKVKEMLTTFQQSTKSKEVRKCLRDVLEKRERIIDCKEKGYILHALWCAFTALLMERNYEDSMYWVITQHLPEEELELPGLGDSDTNAAIAGALIGARDGWEILSSSRMTARNWKKVEKTCDETKEPLRDFLPTDIDRTVKKLLKIAT